MKIYTKRGDGGETSLYRGGVVSKGQARVNAYGEVDELNSQIGWVRSVGVTDDADRLLERIQNELFIIGADLATPVEAVRDGDEVLRLSAGSELYMETAIDGMERGLQPLREFILPGGSTPAAALHLARSVCRRAERSCVRLAELEAVNPAVLVYLNRLSDLLFVMARQQNARSGIQDPKWQKGGAVES